MQTTSSQPRAIYYVVALQIWSILAFTACAPLLIPLSHHQLKYDDNHAYVVRQRLLFAVYAAPILGGYLVDKLLGNQVAVMLERAADGHCNWCSGPRNRSAFLYLSLTDHRLRLAGCFKSNVSCLLGDRSNRMIQRRDGGFSLMCAAGNTARFIAPRLRLQTYGSEYSWAMGFARRPSAWSAGAGDFFLCGNRHFQHTAGVNQAVRAPLLLAELGLAVCCWLSPAVDCGTVLAGVVGCP